MYSTQPQDNQSYRPHNFARAARPCRRGDRMKAKIGGDELQSEKCIMKCKVQPKEKCNEQAKCYRFFYGHGLRTRALLKQRDRPICERPGWNVDDCLSRGLRS